MMSIRSPIEIRSNSGRIRDADLLPTGRHGKPRPGRGAPRSGRISGTRRASPAEPRSARNGLPVPDDLSLLSDQDLSRFNKGTHHRPGEKLAAHPAAAAVYSAFGPRNAENLWSIGDFTDGTPRRLR